MERVFVVFFVLAVLFAADVAMADLSIYAQMLLLAPFPADRSPLVVGLFVAGLPMFLALPCVGVVQHWRGVFKLVLVAMGASPLQVPAAISQLASLLPDPYLLRYSLLRIAVAVVEVGIAGWMLRLYCGAGVWVLGRKQ